MEIHEIIDDSALKVVLDLVDNDLLPNIYQFDVCKIFLILIDSLVDLLVSPDPIAEILTCDFWVLSLVVWRCGLDFHDWMIFESVFPLSGKLLTVRRVFEQKTFKTRLAPRRTVQERPLGF